MRKETFKATGMNYYLDNIKQLEIENEDYALPLSELTDIYGEGERIYKTIYIPDKVELIPEPDNQYDHNAVAVYLDGLKVAHIKRGSCSHVKNLISSPDFEGITVEMGGGKYKTIYEDEETGQYKVDSDTSPIYIHLSVLLAGGDSAEEPARQSVAQAQKKHDSGQTLPKSSEPAPTADHRPHYKYKKPVRVVFTVFAVILAIMSIALALINPLWGAAGEVISIVSIISFWKKV